MKTMLYVEDNADNLKVLQLMINRLRPDDIVLAAATGEEGIATATERLPDLILMDIDLPGMNGYEALEVLRQQPSTRHIPVIAVSAHAMPENVQQGMAAGFAAYITKPVNMLELDETLSQHLAKPGIVRIG